MTSDFEITILSNYSDGATERYETKNISGFIKEREKPRLNLYEIRINWNCKKQIGNLSSIEYSVRFYPFFHIEIKKLKRILTRKE